MAALPKLLAVLGPTASGKSDLAMAVARATGGEILSVDSMQVYRGMDIGTAKPSPPERAAVSHHLIDVVEVDQSFTVAQFVGLANEAIASANRRGVPLIAVGGTPLYFKALFSGLFAAPSASGEIRKQLAQQSGAQLHERLTAVDPSAAARIHPNDSKRLIRALEVHQLTGRPISDLQTQWSSSGPLHEAIWVGLNWEKPALNARINARVKSMMASGWLDETRGLLERYGSFSPSAGQAAGYAELIEHLKGGLPLAETVERIKIATRQLARRQIKWFRRFPNVLWFPGNRAGEENVAEVLRTWTAG